MLPVGRWRTLADLERLLAERGPPPTQLLRCVTNRIGLSLQFGEAVCRLSSAPMRLVDPSGADHHRHSTDQEDCRRQRPQPGHDLTVPVIPRTTLHPLGGRSGVELPHPPVRVQELMELDQVVVGECGTHVLLFELGRKVPQRDR